MRKKGKEKAEKGNEALGETGQASLKSEIESVLFASGKRMEISEIAELVGRPEKEIESGLRQLKEDYDSKKESSLELTNDGKRWKLTVKDRFSNLVSKVVSMTEFPTSVMETLALIAFKYPILQSEVVRIRSNKAYEHLSQLEDAGFITRERFRRTKKIRLTQKFFEYFDFPKEKIQDVFSRFEAVEKEVEREEAEAIRITEEKKQQGRNARKKIENERESVGPLETYDSIADELGSEPVAISAKALEVDVPKASASRKDRQELREALSQEDGLSLGGVGPEGEEGNADGLDDGTLQDVQEDSPSGEETGPEDAFLSERRHIGEEEQPYSRPDGEQAAFSGDLPSGGGQPGLQSQEGPEDSKESKESKDPIINTGEQPEKNSSLEGKSSHEDGVDPFFDPEKPNEEAVESKQDDQNTSEDTGGDAVSERANDELFGSPELEDKYIKEQVEKSEKELDQIYKEVEESKDSLGVKLKKGPLKPK